MTNLYLIILTITKITIPIRIGGPTAEQTIVIISFVWSIPCTFSIGIGEVGCMDDEMVCTDDEMVWIDAVDICERICVDVDKVVVITSEQEVPDGS